LLTVVATIVSPDNRIYVMPDVAKYAPEFTIAAEVSNVPTPLAYPAAGISETANAAVAVGVPEANDNCEYR